MGKTRCSKHGTAHFVVACSHVGDQVDRGELPKCQRLTLVVSLFVCDDCMKSLDFEKYAGLAREEAPEPSDPQWDTHYEAYEAAYEALENPRILCAKCVAELDNEASSLKPQN